MAKRKNRSGFGEDDSNVAEPRESQKGLSQGAWVAIGTLGAALISGLIALLIHLLPPASPSATPSATVPAASPTAAVSAPSPTGSASASPAVVTADAIAGKWSGTAKNGEGTLFQITLEVRKACALTERCGSISVSHVPCEGEIFLEKMQDDVFEFHVDNFFGKSNRAVCQPGAGELFKLRPDGKLSYTTSYERATRGILDRVGD
ncbi:MAG TPA: hypothetical protein VJS64_10740 [Pyrinomonadaceae bacterium]|nr:hypothetical protein [Pyrinomonadaceae bacterium]